MSFLNNCYNIPMTSRTANPSGLIQDPVLRVQNLSLSFQTESGPMAVLRGLCYTLHRGKTLAVVGESGSGKTVQALSILNLLPPNARVDSGEIFYHNNDLRTLRPGGLRRIRGRNIAMIFQDPASSLNPVLTIGEQLVETLRAHEKMSQAAARRRAADLLKQVGIDRAEERLDEYPFQFSGGMCQRVMIAMALSLRPDILIADEPTTALDVTVQLQILRLLKQLQAAHHMAVLFITHNLAVAAQIADDVLVLYAGQCMEYAPAAQLFKQPLHPYTQGLLRSLARVEKKVQQLPAIDGQPPRPGEVFPGCPFAPRCPKAFEKCRQSCPPVFQKEDRRVRCWLEEG